MSLTKVTGSIVGKQVDRSFVTVAEMTSAIGLIAGQLVSCGERLNSVFTVTSGVVGVNGRDIVTHDTLSLSFVIEEKTTVDPRSFGAKWDGATNDKVVNEAVVVYLAALGGGVFDMPFGTTVWEDFDLTGTSGITFQGKGAGVSIVDVQGSTNTAAFRVGWDVPSGGCKRIGLKGFSVTDTTGTITSTRLVALEGGPAGASPSQTTGFFDLDCFETDEFVSATGTALYIDGLSHLNMKSVHQAFEAKHLIGLELAATSNVNTGVNGSTSCSFRGSGHGLKAHATSQLLDSFSFAGCGFFVHDNANALSAIWLRGQDSTVAGINFSGCHAEARSNAASGDQDAILIEGKVFNCSWDSFHLGAGTSTTPQADKGVRFKVDRTSGKSDLRGLIFNGFEPLRVKTGSSGKAFSFDNGCILDPESPILINGIVNNTTSPDPIEFEAGGNEDNIRNSVILDGEVGNRYYDIAAGAAVSFTPTQSEGCMAFIVNNALDGAGLMLYRAEGTSQAFSVGGGTNFTVMTGALVGTTGASGDLTVSAHTDGKIYIENRLTGGGTKQVRTTTLAEYKVTA